MNRQQKELVVKTLRENFQKSDGSFLIGLKGLSVAQIQELRTNLREQGGVLKVSKVRLMKRAIGDIACGDGLMPYLKEQIGVVFAQKESPAVAKVLHDYSKQHKALSLVAGCVEAQVLDKQTVIYIASLPSKEILLVQVCGAIKSPLVGLVFVLRAHLLQLLLVLKQIEQKKR